MKNVLLIDSGSGGLNILKECVQTCPYCNFLMFCDRANLPYGNKSADVLKKITIKNLQKIRSFFRFDIVILACNTLTCTCLDAVRKEFPDVIFIGTVPAVKPALEKYAPQDVLVLATEATIKHNVLVRENPDLSLLPMPTLASEIDEHLDEIEVLEEKLRKSLQKFTPKAVVLGCTHYLAVRNLLQRVFGNETEFFDSANGVVRRLLHFVGEGEATNFQLQIMTSSDDGFLGKFVWYLEQILQE